MNNNFTCKQCGKCCNKDFFKTIKATPNDIELWEKQDRKDILKYLEKEILDIESYESYGLIDFFIDPNTDKKLDVCPFLKKVKNSKIYECTIHEFKPTMCKNYPENGICIRMENKE